MGEECDGKVAAARGGLEIIVSNLDSIRVLGVGTGRTVEAFLKLSVAELASKVIVVPSSLDTALIASRLGFRVLDPRVAPKPDAYIDGADEVVVSSGDMLKGGGGALLGEKILASASNFNIFIVDSSKVVSKLATKRGVPVEVVGGFLGLIKDAVTSLGYRVEYRRGEGKRGPVVSDWGGVIVDVYVDGGIDKPEEFDGLLRSVPGVVATGIFHGYTDYLVIGEDKCRIKVERYRRGT